MSKLDVYSNTACTFPTEDNRHHYGRLEKIELLTLMYGRLSKWNWIKISDAIAELYEGRKPFRTSNGCRNFWSYYFGKLPEEERDVCALIRRGKKPIKGIESYLKSEKFGKKFQDGLCLDDEERRLREEGLLSEDEDTLIKDDKWMDETEALFKKALGKDFQEWTGSEEDILKGL